MKHFQNLVLAKCFKSENLHVFANPHQLFWD